MSIGTRLKQARKDADLSQLQAATEVDVHQKTLWTFEADGKIPSTGMMEKLADLYNKSAGWFSEESEVSSDKGPEEEEQQQQETSE